MIDPIAFQLGNFSIKWYGIMMSIGLIGGYLIFKKISLKEKISKETIIEFYIWVIISLFIGCRLFHVLIYNYEYFINKPWEIFYFWKGGLSSHGGIIGGTLGAFFYCKKNKFNFWKFADRAIIGVSFAAGCVRIGNFLNSEIVGKITTLPWAIKFQGHNDYRHPSQLYEAAKNFFISSLLYKIYYIKNLKLPNGFIYWLFVFLFSILRFFTEFFKEYLIYEQGLTMGQRLSLGLSIISGIILIWLWKKRPFD